MSQRETPAANQIKAAIIALQFLSAIPVGQQAAPTEKEIGASLSWYPLVGLLLGIILCSTSLLITSVFPALLSAALILTLWVVLTGALHLDGFADSADAWMGGLGSKERTLRLLKDPTSGPIAIAATVLLLLLKLLTIELIIKQDIWLLIWPLVFARISASLLFVTTPYARKSGLGSAIAEHKQDHQVWLGSIILMLASCYFLGWAVIIPLLLVSCLSFYYLRSRMMKRLKGCTGDTAGAMIEILECITLLVLVACQ